MLPLSSLFIWFAAFPQVTATFGEVPVAGIALNLVALPLFSLLYPIALFLSLPLLLSVPSGEVFAGTAEGLFSLWEWVADSVTSFFPWTLSWSPLLATLGGGLFLLTVTGGLFPLRGRTIAGAGILLLAAVFFL
jgi:competence protein ComEC